MIRHPQRSRRHSRFGLAAAGLALAGWTMAAAAPAVATAPTVGSRNTATADPPVPRPATKPCTVTLFSNLQFADFNPKTFSYTPPAACPGPWAKVVLEGDFSVAAGLQFDRTAMIAINHVNVFFGTTPEPGSTVSPSWHIERDLTDYSPLFTTAQTGDVDIGNLVNSQFTSAITGSASLQLYPAASFAPAPRTADMVMSLSDEPGGAVLLPDTDSVLAGTFTLPTNVEGAFLDVVTQSQHNDEFWYTCVPNDVATKLQSCNGTAFREGEITIDGQPAGVAPVYPWIFTGGIDPGMWRPIPGVQALNFVPYRVDLTPFASLLADGKSHTVGLSVFNSNNYFQVTATLGLYLDAGSRQVTGAVTENTVGAGPVPTIHEEFNTGTGSTISGLVSTNSTRTYVVAGFVNTSHGRVSTRVSQELIFINVQQFDITSSLFQQQIDQRTLITGGTQTTSGRKVRFAATTSEYPLSANIVVNLNSDGSGTQTTTISQGYDRVERDAGGGPAFASRVTDTVGTGDTLLFNAAGQITALQDGHSFQSYFAQQTGQACYSRSIASQLYVLTSVVDGGGCKAH